MILYNEMDMTTKPHEAYTTTARVFILLINLQISGVPSKDAIPYGIKILDGI